MGNPIEIAAVVVWFVNDTAQAVFEVDDYQKFVEIQSEAAVRKLAGSYSYDNIEDEEAKDRENYKRGDVRNHEDGDADYVKYLYGESSLVNDKSKVYKGGSWGDRLFWLSPGARRYKDEDKSDRTIGFRCAMGRVGGAAGNEDVGGNKFKEGGKSVPRRYK